MDNHATTRCDPRVVEAMLPFLDERFGNPASTTHSFGWEAREAVDAARETIAAAIGATSRELVFTSGATESNNLAILGAAERYGQRGRHVISVATEHPSVLDPLKKLARRGFEVTLLPVIQAPHPAAGRLDPDTLAGAIRSDTILVSVMLANNEIGAIHPLEEIGRICRGHELLLHCDATQAVGRLPVEVDRLGVDLLSFSAHKLYGPKGIGALFVRRRGKRVRLEPILEGGGHEQGLRSGTLNVPGIVGFARAVELAQAEMAEEQQRIGRLRDRLAAGIVQGLTDVALNGPALERHEWRLAGNLNLAFKGVDGQTLLMSIKEVAASTGSACSSATPEPSHVLRALGLSDEAARSSVRFGLGRFNTQQEVDRVVELVIATVKRLRGMGTWQ